jgi:iron complex transport system permease protein
MLGLLLLAGALVLAASVGPTGLDLDRALSDPASVDHAKLFQLRGPRAFAAAITGAALTLAGIVFQALFRNPLASPYVLGVSSGAAFVAVLAFSAGAAYVEPFAFLGALLALALALAAGRAAGGGSAALLLAGVVINALFSAAILLVNVLVEPRNQERILRWMVGGFEQRYESAELGAGLAALVVAAALHLFRARELDLLSMGEMHAAEAGVNVPRVRREQLLAGTLLAAAAVSLAGPIGFVGLLVPHLLRGVVGPDHRLLLAAGVGCGAAFLVLVDVTAQVALKVPLPAGVVTALLGGPLFLAVFMRQRARRWSAP